jgi:hypothetical protein
MNQLPRNDFDRARRAFERWRETRARGTRIPDSLWRTAVALARKYGISKAVLALHVDYYALKERLDAEALEPTGSKEPRPRFLEISAGAAGPAGGCVLEIEDRGRARLRIELKGEATSQIERVARALWSAAR